LSTIEFSGEQPRVRTLNAVAHLAARITSPSRPPARRSSGRPLPRAMGR
jgi:hypothetical protein